ncbi:hypothetical protein BOW50_11725 [Solemya velum gill symbiont]|uniref:hypothetical protein n=1 Tax=Solemya velum gill symbiont TaxID=2340 RepID=UPI0009969B50|nr:hypothetical protein [Solemya velum gill symbiont]OOZ75430.1 hypothetical protein BOW50_11725 [Solemya velum gill symbiont]
MNIPKKTFIQEYDQQEEATIRTLLPIDHPDDIITCSQAISAPDEYERRREIAYEISQLSPRHMLTLVSDDYVEDMTIDDAAEEGSQFLIDLNDAYYYFDDHASLSGYFSVAVSQGYFTIHAAFNNDIDHERLWEVLSMRSMQTWADIGIQRIPDTTMSQVRASHEIASKWWYEDSRGIYRLEPIHR